MASNVGSKDTNHGAPGGGGIEETDAMEYSNVRKPGYIFVQRKIVNGHPTDSYKIDVRSDQDGQPPEVTDCGSFSLKLVPKTCKHVQCITTSKSAACTANEDYADTGNGEGWFKIDDSDITSFVVVFNTCMRGYQTH